MRDNQLLPANMLLPRTNFGQLQSPRLHKPSNRQKIKPLPRNRYFDIVSKPVQPRPQSQPVPQQFNPPSETANVADLPQSEHLSPIERQFAPPVEKIRTKSKKREIISYIGLLLAAAAIGGIITLKSYTYWIIAAYALAALIFRFKSQLNFFIALLFIASVPILLIINQPDLANNYATYGFLMLGIGVFIAVTELRTVKD